MKINEYKALVKPGSKYRNKKCIVDGIKFDSISEANRYKELLLLRKEGAITALGLQGTFRLEINGHLICKYKPDFTYFKITANADEFIVEDVKGFKTPIYRLKKKLMLAIHGIEITEVK